MIFNAKISLMSTGRVNLWVRPGQEFCKFWRVEPGRVVSRTLKHFSAYSDGNLFTLIRSYNVVIQCLHCRACYFYIAGYEFNEKDEK